MKPLGHALSTIRTAGLFTRYSIFYT